MEPPYPRRASSRAWVVSRVYVCVRVRASTRPSVDTYTYKVARFENSRLFRPHNRSER